MQDQHINNLGPASCCRLGVVITRGHMEENIQSKYIDKLRSRHQWTTSRAVLYENQTLVSFDGCVNGEVGCTGWPEGWLVCYPDAFVVLDLDSPTLLTKITVMNTNILASPRNIELFSSSSESGPWEPAYKLMRTQCNRRTLPTPPNTDTTDSESSSWESFYLLGHRTNDNIPIWQARNGLMSVDEHDPRNMASYGHVINLSPCKGWRVSRFWKVQFGKANGAHYIGVNNFVMFGCTNPLPAPVEVSVSVVLTSDERQAVRVTWLSAKSIDCSAYIYKVVAFAGGNVGRGSAGFQRSCDLSVSSVTFDDLLFDTPYVFIVIPVNSDGVEGCPSPPSAPICLRASMTGNRSSDWVLIAIDTITDNFKEVLLETQSSDIRDDANAQKTTILPLLSTEALLDEYSEINSLPCNQQREKDHFVESVRAYRNHAKLTRRESAESYAQSFEDNLQALVFGDIMKAASIKVAKNVTMFISSTFDDTSVERNYFVEQVFPMLSTYCQSLGLSFSTVDLRWGVRDAATDDHMTIDICLGELTRCMESSTAASFVFLSSERYGWRALPNRVLASELELILSHIEEGDAKKTIRSWYLLDENSDPDNRVCILQKISKMKSKTEVKYNDFWGNAQSIMQTAIRDAIEKDGGATIPKEVIRNWSISVTEREVMAGLFKDADTEVNCLVLMRTIEGLAEAVGDGDEKAKVFYTPIDADRTLLNYLRRHVVASVPADLLTEYHVPWGTDGISLDRHGEDIRRLAATFYVNVKEQIRLGMFKRRLLSEEENEWVHHHSFAANRASTFCGRHDVRDAISLLVENRDTIVKCVYGKSGAGKTSIMCVSSAFTFERFREKKVKVLFRACGTSAASSNAMDLMKSLCKQIAHAFNIADEAIEECHKFDEQVSKFHRLLALGSSESPLVVFIDSLDQLSDKDNGRSQPWRWLPFSGPDSMPHTSVIVSVLPDKSLGILEALQTRIPVEAIYEVRVVPPEEAFDLLIEWLTISKRCLVPSQMKTVRETLAGAEPEALTMLYVRLVYDHVVKWKSYDEPEHLPQSIRGMIHLIFDRLEELHGQKLVARTMGLLCASRSGLSATNILDLISGDDGVLGQKGEEGAVLQYHAPPIRRLPPLVFTRWRRDLGDYLVERGENGVPVLNLYHRQFWETAHDRYFRDAKLQRSLHGALADYFSGILSSRFPDRLIDPQPLRFQRTEDASDENMEENATTEVELCDSLGKANRQRLSELPYALIRSGRWRQLVSYLTDLNVLEVYFAAGRSYAERLMVHFDEALRALRAFTPEEARAFNLTDTDNQRLHMFFIFISRWFFLLCVQPDLLPSVAANAPTSSAVHHSAKALRIAAIEVRPLIAWVNRPNAMDACTQSTVFSVPVYRCALSMDGAFYAVAIGAACSIFDSLTSRLVAQFTAHTDLITDVCFSATGEEILTVGRDGAAYVWSATTGDVTKTLITKLDTWITSCTWSPQDPSYLACGCANGIILIWDVLYCHLRFFLEGHSGPVVSCRFISTRDTYVGYLVTGSEDGHIFLWSVHERRMIWGLDNGVAVNCVAVSPNGRMVAVASANISCDLFDFSEERCTLKTKLLGHASDIWSCCFSPDSKELVTAGADRKSLIFSTTTGALLGRFSGHSCWVNNVDWTGTTIVTCSIDKLVKLWDRRSISLAEDAPDSLMAIRLLSNGQRLHAVSKTHALKVMDTSTPALRVIEEHPPPAKVDPNEFAYLSPDGRSWAYGNYCDNFTIVNEGIVYNRNCHVDVASKQAVFDPSGQHIVTGGDGSPDNIVVHKVNGNETYKRLSTDGWVMDLDWTPDGTGILAVCQGSTLFQDVEARDSSLTVGPAGLTGRISIKGDRACIVTSDGGDGYDCKPLGGAIVAICADKSSAVVDLRDPSKTLCHARRGCRWVLNDNFVLIITAASSIYGCPMLSAYRTVDGKCVARFCSPYPNEFDHIDAAVTEDGHALIVVADEAGRIFMLRLEGFDIA